MNFYESNYNVVSENTINNNLGNGIQLINSSWNLFYNNIFTGNNVNAFDGGINNSWNNSITGNYWSDYRGKDIDDDGIGDSVYIIDESNNSIDYYPIW